ncbi:BIIDXI-like protein At5g11420 [Oryza sativa Japonica Group]|uniref:OSJNBb0091E11.14 protein n=9 Tax=Oryza TaxID=4527 RepID=Q0JC35_ORYSJ|nr:uncharacterized protein LOC4336267 [Oryza sativa Japonica Group]XP_052152616.1 protein DUF642 L-GALACTONO-1,4-LACTONE-RESPONSIVE GENE 2-like [Oryza glaberrima]EAY94693.1 hypothetical protein OsI_16470 [Oryza sativa Indica Group]KAB8095913.1 hypothetical protein EE612_024158 [Oryza sativa]EAZ31209.1 hypothetical protein OsJ_15309 [Oryza sativa Japonica Group]KAF2934703.1 hypothetical protein DAI22_04g181900 [Oryza sativa Japonica Group]CAD41544.2 OSJNBb0091E11.14 [Oryza sativa Japonica Grou|eukprot:NP_001053188.1 Os04g0494600 [Oryza sativa Japonica Group]
MAFYNGASVVALLLLVSTAARAAGDGLLLNGNFEYQPSKSQMNGTRVMAEYAIPYWKITGFVEYISSGQKQGDMLLTVPEGAHAVRLGNEASIEQQISVTRGMYYSITFSAARTCAQSEKLNVSVAPGPESGELPIQTVYTSSGWDSYAWAFKAKRGLVSLIIHNHGEDDDPACGPLIDSVAIKTLYPPQATQNNMLRNGDFEEGPYMFPNAAWGVMVPPISEDDHSPLPGWMVMSDTKAVKCVDSAHFTVPHGARAVELVSGLETALMQEVRTVPGRSYRLEFSVGDASDGCVGSMQVKGYAGQGCTTVTYSSQGTGGHTRASLEFAAVANTTRVVFVSSTYITKWDGTLCGPVVDDASLVCVSQQQPPARRLLRL